MSWLGWLCWPGRSREWGGSGVLMGDASDLQGGRGWVCVLMGRRFRSSANPLPSPPHLSSGLRLSQSQPGIPEPWQILSWGIRLLSTEAGTLSLATKFPCPATSWLEPQPSLALMSTLLLLKPRAYPSIHYLPPLTLWCSFHVDSSLWAECTSLLSLNLDEAMWSSGLPWWLRR